MWKFRNNNSQIFIKMMELRKKHNNTSNFDINKRINKLTLTVYSITQSIILSDELAQEPNSYYIDLIDNKLYKYDFNGSNPTIANGAFFIAISNDINYLNKAYKSIDGNLEEINTYFDGTNLKLIINNIEETKEGTLILTDDKKIFVRIGNSWFGK